MDDYDHCEHLATVHEVDKTVCTVVTGHPISGNMVRVSITGSPLAICEMKVFAS